MARPRKPTAVLELTGAFRKDPQRRRNEPGYSPGVPDQPPGMSEAARKIWDSLVDELVGSGVLRTIDAWAFADLCEDQAMLNEMRAGLEDLKRKLVEGAKEKGQTLTTRAALIGISRSTEGRRMLATIRELAAAVTSQRHEFGLTPASNSRIQASGTGAVEQEEDVFRDLAAESRAQQKNSRPN